MASITQSPGRLDISMNKGDTLSRLISIDMDLTDYTFSATSNIAIVLTPVSSTDGTVNMSIAGSATSGKQIGKYPYRISWTTPQGVKRTIISGTISVT